MEIVGWPVLGDADHLAHPAIYLDPLAQRLTPGQQLIGEVARHYGDRRGAFAIAGFDPAARHQPRTHDREVISADIVLQYVERSLPGDLHANRVPATRSGKRQPPGIGHVAHAGQGGQTLAGRFSPRARGWAPAGIDHQGQDLLAWVEPRTHRRRISQAGDEEDRAAEQGQRSPPPVRQSGCSAATRAAPLRRPVPTSPRPIHSASEPGERGPDRPATQTAASLPTRKSTPAYPGECRSPFLRWR